LQRALQHLHVDDGHLGLAKANAAGLGELGHFGQHLALEAARERAQREHARQVQLFGAELEHVHQARLVEHRVGVGRAHQRLVTPPATAAAISLSSMPACSCPGSRSRTDKSTRPGATTQPLASMVRLGWKSGAIWPMAMMRPAAIATSAGSSRPVAGSMTRPFWIRIFMG
jgi:hypothetical protein